VRPVWSGVLGLVSGVRTSRRYGRAWRDPERDHSGCSQCASGKCQWIVESDERANSHLSGKRHQVVLAETEDLNVLYNDQLVVVLVKDGAVDYVPEILFVAFCEEHHCFCVSLRSAMQTLSVGVFTDAFEKSSNRARQFLKSLRSLLWG